MFTYALLVIVVLFGQLRAADERYPLAPSGQAPAGGTAAAGANPGDNAGKSGLLPLSDSSQPATSGAAGNAASDIFPAAGRYTGSVWRSSLPRRRKQPISATIGRREAAKNVRTARLTWCLVAQRATGISAGPISRAAKRVRQRCTRVAARRDHEALSDDAGDARCAKRISTKRPASQACRPRGERTIASRAIAADRGVLGFVFERGRLLFGFARVAGGAGLRSAQRPVLGPGLQGHEHSQCDVIARLRARRRCESRV